MKKFLVITCLALFSFGVNAQEQKKDKNAKVYLEVDGICGMCKKRIEGAALKTKGVKFASWDVKSHQLSLIMDERKTDVKTVQQSILNVGHDIILSKNKKLEAALEAYNSVHPCCKYRDEEIVLDHEGEMKKQKKSK